MAPTGWMQRWTVGPVLIALAAVGAMAIVAKAWGGSPTPTVLDKQGWLVAAYGGWAARVWTGVRKADCTGWWA